MRKGVANEKKLQRQGTIISRTAKNDISNLYLLYLHVYLTFQSFR